MLVFLLLLIGATSRTGSALVTAQRHAAISEALADAGGIAACWLQLAAKDVANSKLENLDKVLPSTDITVPCRGEIRNAAAAAMAIANGTGNASTLANRTLKELAQVRHCKNVTLEMVEDVLAIAAENQTAETERANGELLTASEIADMLDGFRGEEIGANGSMDLIQGDMKPENSTQLRLWRQGEMSGSTWLAAGTPWRDAVVKYCFASDLSSRAKHMFEVAVEQYKNAVPCLRFENVGWRRGASADTSHACQESPAIFVTSDPSLGCFSYVGMTTGMAAQQLQIQDPGCMLIGTVIHELGHALGMAHEQSRPDRDQHVRVNYDNVIPGQEHNFAKDPHGYTGEPYDYLSVMHYDAFAFAKDRSRPTLEKIGDSHAKMGQRVGLSTTDIAQVAAMYEEVTSGCQTMTAHGAAVPQGMGCVNVPDDFGRETCPSKISWCHPWMYNSCCSCGGGIQVQCYTGRECPEHALVGRIGRYWPAMLAVGCCGLAAVAFIIGVIFSYASAAPRSC